MKFYLYNWTLVTKTRLFTIFEKWFEISLSYWMCLLGTVCTCFRFEENSIVKGKASFFLPKANYTMKNLLNSLRPFFKFAKFLFGAESKWSILKNLIRKMACSLRHPKKWYSFINQSQSKIAQVFFHLFKSTFLQKLWWCLAILAELGTWKVIVCR